MTDGPDIPTRTPLRRPAILACVVAVVVFLTGAAVWRLTTGL